MNYQDYELKEYSTERQWAVSEVFPMLMRKVYVWMTLALVITGVVAYGVATSPGFKSVLQTNPTLFWVLALVEIGLVIGISAAINRISLAIATLMFIVYSVINGVMMSSIFMV